MINRQWMISTPALSLQRSFAQLWHKREGLWLSKQFEPSGSLIEPLLTSRHLPSRVGALHQEAPRPISKDYTAYLSAGQLHTPWPLPSSIVSAQSCARSAASLKLSGVLASSSSVT
jgi:hypothetical protein